jgi:GTP-binding protein EngB required for normal cell division
MQETPEAEIPKFKIIFLGDQGVGKSSILNRFAHDKFEQNYLVKIFIFIF